TADTCGDGSNRAAVRSRAELSLVPDARTNGRGELHIREPRAMHAVDRRQHGALLRESGLHVSSCVCAKTTATERLAASHSAACRVIRITGRSPQDDADRRTRRSSYEAEKSVISPASPAWRTSAS